MGSLATDMAGLLVTLGVAADGGSSGGPWPVFEATLPASPDEAVAVFPLPGLPPSLKAGAGFPHFQVRVRGAPNLPAPALAKMEEVAAELSGYSGTLDGTKYTHVYPLSSGTFPLGPDDRNRPEFTMTFATDRDFP